MAPVSLNIVVFRYRWPEMTHSQDQLTTELVALLQTDGAFAPSTTTIRGTVAIRVNLTNHRTQDEDLEALIQAVIERGRRLSSHSE